MVMLYLVHFSRVNLDQIISWLLVGYFASGLVFTLPGEWKQAAHRVLARKNTSAS